MLEVAIFSAIGWLLLAAASHRFRRDAGVTVKRVPIYRLAAIVALAVALWHCSGARAGERWVELLGGMSLGAVAVVLALSFRPHAVLAPVRAISRAAARVRG